MEFKKLFVGYFMKSQMKSVDGSSAAPLTNVAAAGLCCPPGCFEQRAQLCVKSADSGPSPSRPGCLWNLELRCNVGESGSCFHEARSGFLSTSTTRTFALLLSLCQLSLSFTALFSPVLHTFTAQYSLCLSILSSFPHLFCFSPCLLFPPPPDCCIPALPGDRDCWLCLCLCRAAVLRAVHICSYSSLSQDMFAHFTLT